MNFYQAGYFRQGMQGGNAGWGIVSPSRGMSQIAKEGFKGISANLVELKKGTTMPVVNYGIFQHDRFVYMLHVNYAAKGEDARGVVFVHGYCFNITDYYELCLKPEMLLGIREENFLMEYDASVEQYSVKEVLVYDALSYDELFEKYRFTHEEYRGMILCAINALEGYTDPLCIKIDLPADAYLQAAKELVYLVMMGLPYHLRCKLSFFSYEGSRSAVYVSSHVQGNNYVDLDNREFPVDTSRLQYEFTKIYNNVPSQDYKKRELYFKAIADFMNNVFQNPLHETGCVQIEHGFQAMIKKNEAEGILPEMALELLYSFLKCNLSEQDEVYEYLGALVKVINDNLLRISGQWTVKRLSNGYKKTENVVYKNEVCRLLASEFRLGDREESFAELNRLSRDSCEQFLIICNELQATDGEYYKDYYIKGYLTFDLTDIKKIKAHLGMGSDQISIDQYQAVLEILLNVTLQDMKQADVFWPRYRIIQDTTKILKECFPKEMAQRVKEVWHKILFYFWEYFDIAEFWPDDIDGYKRIIEEDKIAESGWNGDKSRTEDKVVRLMKLFDEGWGEDAYVQNLCDIFFTNDVLADVAQKKRIQKLLKDRIVSVTTDDKAEAEDKFDCWLVLFYDFKEMRFDTVQWAKNFRKSTYNAFEIGYINRVVDKSWLMKRGEIKESFKESLADDIKRAKREGVDSDILKGLKRYERYLSGKELKEDRALKKQKRFIDTLCRIPIGALILLAAGMLLNLAVQNDDYGVLDKFVLWAEIIFLLLFAVVTVIKVFCMWDGAEDLMQNSGIENIQQLILYLLFDVLFLTGVVVVVLMDRFEVITIAANVYLIIAVISLSADGILTRN